MTDLLERLRAFISKENLLLQKDRLLLAVSGGMDSVVLCELCSQAGFDFIVAHCNFQLRGEESKRDEIFVHNLAKKYDKLFLLKRFDTLHYALEKKISVQVAARELRYDWFGELLENPGLGANILDFKSPALNFILTAHHLDDNVETLLMNFFKGTGIAGLHGILPKQGKIVRPLLFAKKDELRKFADEHCLSWIEDSSNESDKYTRNYFRHQVIPVIEKIYPGTMNNLSANINRFRDIEILYRQSILLHKKKLFEQRGNEIYIPVLKLKKSEPLRTIVYEIIKDYNFTAHQADDVIDLLDSEPGKYIRSSSHRIIKNRRWLIISPNNLEEAETIIIDDVGCWQLATGKFELEIGSALNHKLQTTNKIAQLDAEKIKFPLLLRKWKQGDYFYPFGMKKKKKVARFLIDNKLSKNDKEKVYVVEMNKKIIWVAGMRIDERFKITQQTKNVLVMGLSK
ncbi:MAG: tRNA lysidine(34) synthetase TilS [Bacteroidetes bacterium]|nr:tRNA lysidine(34) synthetase TilS [Bacteroidota bacterium]